MKRIIALIVLFCAMPSLGSIPARAVTIAWTPVGNPGNAADGTGFGAVPYAYNIDKYDVTNSQYVEFLNIKDPTGADPLGLYNNNMSNATFGGINFNAGSVNGSKYTFISGRQNHPVNYVTWYDAIRFANWLNNGQGNSDTESGAYTLLGGTPTPSNGDNIDPNRITRNIGAIVFLPSEDEWYKAAYYNPRTHSYFRYPTSSDTTPIASSPTALPNHANFFPGGPVNLTDVGAYSGTTSPYGTFDQGGNVFQWDEGEVGIIFNGGQQMVGRVLRGGANNDGGNNMLSIAHSGDFATDEFASNGFRVAMIPEPSSFVLAALALACLAACGWRRRKR